MTEDNNTTFSTNMSLPPSQQPLASSSSALFLYTSFASGIFIAALAFITIVGNGLLLLAIWKDPLKTFRTPTTYFVVGLSTADFLTGIFVSPAFAFLRVVTFSNPALRKSSLAVTIAKISTSASLLTMNASYLILLFLTWYQFSAISFPHQHRNLVSKRRVCVCVSLTWVYAFVFALLPISGINDDLLYRLDLFLNTTTSLCLLVLAYTCLYVAYRRQMTRISCIRQFQPTHTNQTGRPSRRSERQFTIVNMLLVLFVVVCTLPSTIIWYLTLHWTSMSPEDVARLRVASLFGGNVLFLKFALDPFIYCWRLPPYRRSLRSILLCAGSRVQRWEIFSHSPANLPVAVRSQRRLRNTQNTAADGSIRMSRRNVVEVQSVV